MVDRRAAESAEHGYGGTLLPPGTEVDATAGNQAIKAIRLILDNDVRQLALSAHEAMCVASMLGTRAKIFETGPVSLAEGDRAAAQVAFSADAALKAIADRIRTLAAE